MIKSFRDKSTEALFKTGQPADEWQNFAKVARRKLVMVDSSTRLEDLRKPPGNRLHPLYDDRAGQHAIWINTQYRVCFRWDQGHAYDVEITDYH